MVGIFLLVIIAAFAWGIFSIITSTCRILARSDAVVIGTRGEGDSFTVEKNLKGNLPSSITINETMGIDNGCCMESGKRYIVILDLAKENNAIEPVRWFEFVNNNYVQESDNVYAHLIGDASIPLESILSCFPL